MKRDREKENWFIRGPTMQALSKLARVEIGLWVQGINLPSHALHDIIAQKACKIVYSYEPLQHQALWSHKDAAHRRSLETSDQAKHEWAGSGVMLNPDFTSLISWFRGIKCLCCFFKGQGPLNGAMKHAWLKEQRRCTAGKPIESACRCVNSYTPGGKASQKLSARCTANFMRTVPVPLPCTNARTVQHQPWTISGQV